ncbi:hypothetical protein GGS24DRAFT_91390 [Hypoxylon argillaceum]|nr:hypothetical protein GGS24DRAFT_91390 [Hypoxylon argillaceum]
MSGITDAPVRSESRGPSKAGGKPPIWPFIPPVLSAPPPPARSGRQHHATPPGQIEQRDGLCVSEYVCIYVCMYCTVLCAAHTPPTRGITPARRQRAPVSASGRNAMPRLDCPYVGRAGRRNNRFPPPSGESRGAQRARYQTSASHTHTSSCPCRPVVPAM